MADEENRYVLGGKTYDLVAPQIAEMSGKGVRWVYVHAQTRLGGVKRTWDGGERETLRFCSADMPAILKELELP